MRRIYLPVPILILVVFSGRGLSQQPAFLQGVVVDAASDAPIGKATVELRLSAASGSLMATTISDRDGKFFFPSAAPGTYRIVAKHNGHVPAEYGQRRFGAPGEILSLTPGQRRTDLRIAMTAGGVVSGRLTDKGQPIGLADAVALKAIFIEGQLSLTPVLAARTDDLGQYSLFWLPPGRYYIVGVSWDTANSVPRYVNPEGDNSNSYWAQRYIGRAVFLRASAAGVGENEAHIPIYYPGTPDPRLARIIEIQAGAVLRGIDIDASALPTRHVRGRVLGIPAPSPGQGVNMRLLLAGLRTSDAQAPGADIDSNGYFDIPNAVPGEYALTATSGTLTGRVMVDVRDRDVNDVVVSLSPGMNLSGRVVIERANGVSPDPAISSLRVVLRSDPVMPGGANYVFALQADGSFTLPPRPPATGVGARPPAGNYRVLVTPILSQPSEAPPGPLPTPLQNLYVKSIRLGDVDVLNDGLHLDRQPQEPLTIVIGANPATLTGRVLDDRQQPVPGATLVLVHDNGLRYRVNEKSMFSDVSGGFRFEGLGPGPYKLFAWESIERGAWHDQSVMRSFESRGTVVRIEEGREMSVDVKVIEK